MTGIHGAARCLTCGWTAAGDGADQAAERHTRRAGHPTATEWAPVPLDGVGAIGRATGASHQTVMRDVGPSGPTETTDVADDQAKHAVAGPHGPPGGNPPRAPAEVPGDLLKDPQLGGNPPPAKPAEEPHP